MTIKWTATCKVCRKTGASLSTPSPNQKPNATPVVTGMCFNNKKHIVFWEKQY